MEENKTQLHIGPAIAIVVIIAVIATAGILFYKHMIQEGYYQNLDHVAIQEYQVEDTEDDGQKLSTSTDLDTIEQDLNATDEIDISLLDEIDENLLDFDDLDNFDFDFESTSST